MTEKGWTGLLYIVGTCALAVGLVFITMGLWNALMPDIFGLPRITPLQAAGLMILSTLLFWRKGG